MMIEDTRFNTDLAYRYNAYRTGPGSSYTPLDIDAEHGLKRTLVYYSNARSTTPFVKTDLYYDRDGNDLTTFIACRPDQKPPRSPGCDEFFQDGLLIYKLGFSKENLSRWRDFKAQTHSLLQSFSLCTCFRTKYFNQKT